MPHISKDYIFLLKEGAKKNGLIKSRFHLQINSGFILFHLQA